jgi:hypothetical protein
MTMMFAVCFFSGVGLAVLSFISGLDKINVFEHFLGHGHHFFRLGRHHHATHSLTTKGRSAIHVSPINMAAITAFLAWFGGAGMALLQLTHWIAGAIVAVAVAFGLTGATIINRFMKMLMSSERVAQPLNWPGTIATVTMPIRASDGTGEIVFLHDGVRRVAGARSDTGRGIDKGAEVIVTKYEKGIAYVCTWEELPAAPLEH